IILGVMVSLTSFAREFTYTYKGQTIEYTVIDEAAKTCMTKEGGYYYGYYAGNYNIIGTLTIPEIVKDGEIEYSVTTIGALSFYGCNGLTSISIPSSVITIGQSAFRGCSALASLTIPNSVTSIGNSAFDGCASLKELTIEDGDKDLNLGYTPGVVGSDFKYGLFSDCPLEALYVGRNLSYDAYYTYSLNYREKTGVCSPFSYIKTLKLITIDSSVSSIGKAAFYYCSGLTSIEIPTSVTSIGDDALYGCSGLTSVTIPNSVISIGGSAFSECTSLNKLTIEDGKTPIYLGCTFSNCPLETLYLGRNYNSPEYGYPFRDITELVQLTIGGLVTSIDPRAFNG
ncbi:MAG: leucine-rich repeat domain-containing protein, partial [Muribaculaceae bacterium]|nr:leucine-rich repeat domain-containing protein [Muribaculaceae bacterium]